MPVYEYKCTVCEQRFDIEQSFSDDPLTTLEGCEVDDDGWHRLKKVFSAVGIAFKGEGFYRNDARGAKRRSAPTSDGDSASTTTSTNGKSSDSSSSDSSKKESSSTGSGSGTASSGSSSSSGSSGSSGSSDSSS